MDFILGKNGLYIDDFDEGYRERYQKRLDDRFIKGLKGHKPHPSQCINK